MMTLRRIAAGLCLAALATGPVAPLQAASVDLPAAAGSLGPNIARNDNGTLLLSWLEPAGPGRHALRVSRWQNGRWQPPRTVASGDNWFVNWADFPSVVPVNGDFWSAHWLVRRPAGGYAYDVYVAASDDAGESWSEPRRPHRDDTDTEHGFVSTFRDGAGAGLVWLDGRHTGGDQGLEDEQPAGMTLRTATLAPDGSVTPTEQLDQLICDCCQTDVTVSQDGPVVVYRDRTPDEIRDIYVARRIDGRWREGEAVADDGWNIPGCPVNGPVVASRDREVVVAWFTAADGQPRVRLARSADPTQPFSAPVDVIDGNAVGRVGLVLLDDGSAVVSALKASAPGRAALVLTRIAANGERLATLQVADDLPMFNVPQIARDGDELLLVWTERHDGVFALRSARLPVTDL